jgi:hypothetical protein
MKTELPQHCSLCGLNPEHTLTSVILADVQFLLKKGWISMEGAYFLLPPKDWELLSDSLLNQSDEFSQGDRITTATLDPTFCHAD